MNTSVKLCIAISLLFFNAAYAEKNSILVQSTTSTANSGLYEYLLPHFESLTGVKVNVVAVGTGQAIRNASNCDADVLLVHAKSDEEEFVRKGFGTKRYDLMYNDFVIVGPADDPANILQASSVIDALRLIADNKTVFASRGDNSGTHKKEISLWQKTAIDPTTNSGKWYRETGSGMGATLNIAVAMGAYVITDRATWINFKNRAEHTVLYEGDESLFNQYGVTAVSAHKCPDVNGHASKQFIDWLTNVDGQRLIGNYRIDDQQLFFPNAQSSNAQ